MEEGGDEEGEGGEGGDGSSSSSGDEGRIKGMVKGLKAGLKLGMSGSSFVYFYQLGDTHAQDQYQIVNQSNNLAPT